MKHSDITSGFIHTPFNWIYATASDRTAAVAFQTADVNKQAVDLDTGEIWLLKAVDGSGNATWQPLASSLFELPVRTAVVSSGTAVAGAHGPVDATSANLSRALPTGQPAGTLISVEKTDASTHTVNITGSVRGVGAQTLTLQLQHEQVLFIADAAGSWWPIAGHKTLSSLDSRYVRDSSLDATSPVAAPSSPRNRALRDFYSAKDYGVSANGTADDTSNLLMFNEDCRAHGKKAYYPAGTYLVSASITDSTNRTQPLIVEGEDPASTIIKQAASFPAVSIFNLQGGGLSSTVSVTAPSAAGANQLVVSSTAGWAAGDMLLLRDSTQPVYGLTGGTRGVCSLSGEYALIKSVDSSTQVTFYGRLDFGYTTSADVRKLLTPQKLRISKLGFLNNAPGTQSGGAKGIVANYFRDLEIRHVAFTDMDADCIALQWGVDFTISDPNFLQTHDLEIANNPYCTEFLKAVQHGLFEHARSRYGRHVVTTGGAAATEVGQSHIVYADGIAANHSQAAWDCHPGAWKIGFRDLATHNSYPGCSGIQVRGADCTVENPTVDQCDVGVQFVDSADRGRLVGGRITGCDIGALVASSDACYIGGALLIDSPKTNGLSITRDTPWAAFMSTLDLGEIKITGSPSGGYISNAPPVTINYVA